MKTILVIDDDIRATSFASEYFKNAGYNVLTAKSEDEAKLLLGANPIAARTEIYTYGDLVIDNIAHQVYINDKPVSLTRTEYAILKLLIMNQNEVLTKATILDKIVADTPDCTDGSLKTHICHLRSKLKSIGEKDYIDAVWGVGFKMNGNVAA